MVRQHLVKLKLILFLFWSTEPEKTAIDKMNSKFFSECEVISENDVLIDFINTR
jgi:hypothetical protein